MQAKSSTEAESRSTRRTNRNPSGPKGWPLVGHLIDVARDPLGFFTACASGYGDVVALRFGSWPMLLLSSPDHVEQVLVKEHHNFIKVRFFWRQVTAIFGNGLVTSEGEFWRRQRRLAAPAFSGQRLTRHAAAMVAYTERMLDGWSTGQPRELHADMMALTLHIAAKTLFNTEVEEDVTEIDNAVTALTDEIASRVARPFVIPDAVPLPGHIRYRRGLRRIEQVVARMINERRSRLDNMGDLLSTFMLARDENGEPMSDRQLRDEVVTLLLAGHETTALALSWTWYLITSHPEVQDELASEADQVLAGRAATVEDLPRLGCAERVVTEALRLYPPAWVIGREAVQDCLIGGYPVMAGTALYMSPWVIQRDPRFFDNPSEFRPERWVGLADQLPRFAYFPFGGGPRVCIGNRFAMMEAVLILVTMIQRVRLARQQDRTVTPLPSITLRPRGGVWVVPALR
jgi:cytochrome P450